MYCSSATNWGIIEAAKILPFHGRLPNCCGCPGAEVPLSGEVFLNFSIVGESRTGA
jgi:hypothetical protein